MDIFDQFEETRLKSPNLSEHAMERFSVNTHYQERFGQRTVEALSTFPTTAGRCANLCAFISNGLKEDGVEHCVALGSLSCRGIKTFQYRKAFPRRPNQEIVWDGHAWIEFNDNSIGEPSLLRTAQTLPIGSNLRSHLDQIGILRKGAIMISKQQQQDWALKYTKKQQLPDSVFDALISGLIFLNK